MTPLQQALTQYVEKEPMWMQGGGDPKALMEKVASDNGVTFPDLRNTILDHYTTQGAG